jgi:hypothetical protein
MKKITSLTILGTLFATPVFAEPNALQIEKGKTGYNLRISGDTARQIMDVLKDVKTTSHVVGAGTPDVGGVVEEDGQMISCEAMGGFWNRTDCYFSLDSKGVAKATLEDHKEEVKTFEGSVSASSAADYSNVTITGEAAKLLYTEVLKDVPARINRFKLLERAGENITCQTNTINKSKCEFAVDSQGKVYKTFLK